LANFKTKQDETNRFVEEQGYNIFGLVRDKEKNKKYLEGNQAITLDLEVIREEAMNLNEKLKLEQKKYFYILNYIKRNMDDHMRLEDQIDEIKYRYQKDNNVFF
jgi:hypothetical protein